MFLFNKVAWAYTYIHHFTARYLLIPATTMSRLAIIQKKGAMALLIGFGHIYCSITLGIRLNFKCDIHAFARLAGDF